MRRILVLDDEPLIAMLIQEWLAELGCETLGPAGSVAAALDLIEDTALDGAILDVSLGGENCYSVADVLHQRQVPFAFATGRDAGAIDGRFQGALLLPKPFDLDAIRRVVDHFHNAAN